MSAGWLTEASTLLVQLIIRFRPSENSTHLEMWMDQSDLRFICKYTVGIVRMRYSGSSEDDVMDPMQAVHGAVARKLPVMHRCAPID